MTTQARLLELLKSDKDIWSQFTREEEYASKEVDVHGRFPSKATRHGDPLEPRVSKYLIDKGLSVRFPEGRSFAVCLTHDIDLLKPHSVRNFRVPGPVKLSLMRLSRKFEAAWNFNRLLDLEESFGARSTFFFMALGPQDQGFNYRIEEVQEELGTIMDRGWEIGLHGGHSASFDPSALKTEKGRLEKELGRKVLGCRNHYLRIKVPSTWRLQAQAGFEYDSTLGYADSIGFRNGMCHPFSPYDLGANETIGIIEVPLVVMDGSLFGYMKLDVTEAWEMTKRLIDKTQMCQGVLTVLWHNTHMRGDMLEFYKKLLQYCYEKGAWMTSGQEIARWWRTDPYGFG